MYKYLLLLLLLGGCKSTAESLKDVDGVTTILIYDNLDAYVYYLVDEDRNLCFAIWDGYQAGSMVEIDCDSVRGE